MNLRTISNWKKKSLKKKIKNDREHRNLEAVNFIWKARGEKAVSSPCPFGVMGILNLDPHSFYDKGINAKDPVKYAFELKNKGAQILDIGAESSRPGSKPLVGNEENERLAPVINSLKEANFSLPISVDTWHGETAKFVLKKGVDIINDISACQWDEELLEVLAFYKPGYVLTHSSAKPEIMRNFCQYDNIVEDIKNFFEIALTRLVKAGLPEDHVVLDPGIGFGKTSSQNLEILKKLSSFLLFKRPLLIGLSMKSFFGELFSLDLSKRSVITAAASLLAWQNGVFWHRAHHPDEIRDALTLAAMLRQ